MELEGLSIALGAIDEDLKTAREHIARDAARETADKLDVFEARTQKLIQELGISPPPNNVSLPAIPGAKTPPEPKPVAGVDWDQLVCDARERLVQRGVDVDQLALADWLDPDEVKRIEMRFSGDFTLRSKPDCYDTAAAIATGLAAGLVDFLIVRIPKDILYLRQFAQSGSPFTQWLRSFDVPADNWLATYCKTSFDKVSQVSAQITGFGPTTHRLQTFGHDPLLGLVIGTIDIMRGGLTAINKEGQVVTLSGQGAPIYNPLVALTHEILHLISDGFTPMGIPAPGWSVATSLQVGHLGPNDQTVAEMARWMYLQGYDSRHFLTMTTSVAAAETILRSYFWTRRWLDQEYHAEMSHVAAVAGAITTSAHPRFQGMALIAHAVATGINMGKVAVCGGNPLAINYAQWLRFLHASFNVIQTKLRSPSDVLIGYGCTGLQALEQGWPDLDDPDMPILIVR